jgi:hypothetical protein
MREHSVSLTDLTRRGFLGGAITAAVVARAVLALPASAEVAARASSAPVNIATATDSMMHQWRWWFDLAGERDGSFTLTGVMEPLGEEDEDKVFEEIAPVTGLRSGVEIFEALLRTYGGVGETMEDTDIEGAASRLEGIDPALAQGFLRAAEQHYIDLFGE